MYISSAKLKYFTLRKARCPFIFGTEGINPIYYYLHVHTKSNEPIMPATYRLQLQHKAHVQILHCIPLPVCSLLQNGLHGACEEPTRHGYTPSGFLKTLFWTATRSLKNNFNHYFWL